MNVPTLTELFRMYQSAVANNPYPPASFANYVYDYMLGLLVQHSDAGRSERVAGRLMAQYEGMGIKEGNNG